MSDKPKVVDGADRRKMRLLELLVYIKNMEDKGGASSRDIKSFMTIRFGLKWKTTAEYIEELHQSRLIAQGGPEDLGKWFVTRNYKRMAQYLYG